MPTFTYTQGIPNPPSAPSTNVGDMQTNTNSIFGIIAVDHAGFSPNPNGGTHNQSTYNAGGDPNTSTTQGAAYTKVVGSDIELFYRHKGNGTVVQLTSAITPAAASPGYTFLPGGILMQWGKQLGVGTTTPVVFPIPFKAATLPYTIQLTYADATTSILDPVLSVGSGGGLSNLGFNIRTVSAITFNVYWVAIGTA